MRHGFFGHKAPIPPNCDAIEALLRLELLTQFPNWLTQKATMLSVHLLKTF